MTVYDTRRWANCFKAGLLGLALSSVPMVSSGQWLPTYPGVGFVAGFMTGLLELFVYREFLRRTHFLVGLILKSISYTLAIYVVILFFLTLGLVIWYGPGGKSVAQYLNREFLAVMLQSYKSSIIIVFLFQLDDLLGDGVFRKYLLGFYHQPKVQQTVVMFLDIKASTTITEQMGDARYYAFLDDFFHAVSRPILENRGEIYKYVGDQIIICWPEAKGVKDSRCVKCFFDISDAIEKNRPYFMEKYGMTPPFRAALHVGPVVVALIGDIRKEIVYNGDVLNTTSRLEAVCSTYKTDLIVSGPLMEKLQIPSQFTQELLGCATLKGKMQPMDVYAVRRINS